MDTLNRLLLVLHFLGMAMGFSVSFANMVLAGVMGKAAASDEAILARFPPAMSRVGDIGLVLLWATGLTLVFTRYNGFAGPPFTSWTFHVKLTAVVLLTGIIGYMHMLMRKARSGDAAAAARLPIVGRFAFLMAITVVVFAVATFD